MNAKQIDRILREARSPELLEILSERISLSDLQSLLLEVYRQKTQAIEPHQVLDSYRQNRFVQPAQVDPLLQMAFDRLAFSLLPAEFETMELSPLAPLASCAALAPVHQNNVLSTIRGTEVSSDPTNVLALECALRRKKILKAQPKSPRQTKLCSSQRVVRTQVFDIPDAFPHFRLFALCTAGRDTGGWQFETNAICEHIDFYLRVLNRLDQIDKPANSLKVHLYVAEHPMSAEPIEKTVRGKHPEVQVQVLPISSEQDYYQDFRFHIFAKNRDGEDFFLIDGGLTNWTRKLLNNNKERLLISGMGSERLLACF